MSLLFILANLASAQDYGGGDGTSADVNRGTASGAYHFPLSQTTYSTYCEGDSGIIPGSGLRFDLIPGTHQQKDEVTVALVDIHLGERAGYEVTTLSLRDGVLVPLV